MTAEQNLVNRVRTALSGQQYEEIENQNGVFFMLNQHVACGVHDEFLVVKVGEERLDEILTHPLARVFEMADPLFTGCVEIVPKGTSRDVDLNGWVKTGLVTARSMS